MCTFKDEEHRSVLGGLQWGSLSDSATKLHNLLAFLTKHCVKISPGDPGSRGFPSSILREFSNTANKEIVQMMPHPCHHIPTHLPIHFCHSLY